MPKRVVIKKKNGVTIIRVVGGFFFTKGTKGGNTTTLPSN